MKSALSVLVIAACVSAAFAQTTAPVTVKRCYAVESITVDWPWTEAPIVKVLDSYPEVEYSLAKTTQSDDGQKQFAALSITITGSDDYGRLLDSIEGDIEAKINKKFTTITAKRCPGLAPGAKKTCVKYQLVASGDWPWVVAVLTTYLKKTFVTKYPGTTFTVVQDGAALSGAVTVNVNAADTAEALAALDGFLAESQTGQLKRFLTSYTKQSCLAPSIVKPSPVPSPVPSPIPSPSPVWSPPRKPLAPSIKKTCVKYQLVASGDWPWLVATLTAYLKKTFVKKYPGSTFTVVQDGATLSGTVTVNIAASNTAAALKALDDFLAKSKTQKRYLTSYTKQSCPTLAPSIVKPSPIPSPVPSPIPSPVPSPRTPLAPSIKKTCAKYQLVASGDWPWVVAVLNTYLKKTFVTKYPGTTFTVVQNGTDLAGALTVNIAAGNTTEALDNLGKFLAKAKAGQMKRYLTSYTNVPCALAPGARRKLVVASEAVDFPWIAQYIKVALKKIGVTATVTETTKPACITSSAKFYALVSYDTGSTSKIKSALQATKTTVKVCEV